MAAALRVFRDNAQENKRLEEEQKEAQKKQVDRAENLEALMQGFEQDVSKLLEFLLRI